MDYNDVMFQCDLARFPDKYKEVSLPTLLFLMSHNIAVERVIFNPPATIVIWKDGTKTVVKTYLDKYDHEIGVAMCIVKKLFGSRSAYKKFVKSYTNQKT